MLQQFTKPFIPLLPAFLITRTDLSTDIALPSTQRTVPLCSIKQWRRTPWIQASRATALRVERVYSVIQFTGSATNTQLLSVLWQKASVVPPAGANT